MIKKEVAKSRKIAELKNDKARSLYFMIYPHVDVEGRHSADPYDIKAECIPLFEWTIPEIIEALGDLRIVGLILLYEVDNRRYLQITRFKCFQRLDTKKEAFSKHPSPPENSRELQRTPENSPISKDKISKDNKEQPMAVKTALDKIYKEGFNIYSLINRLKKELRWNKGRNFPDEVILALCEQYHKNKGEISKAWPWFKKVLTEKSREHFATNNQKEATKIPKRGLMPQSIKELFK